MTAATALIVLQNGFAVMMVCAALILWFCRMVEVPHFTLWLFIGGLLLRILVLCILHPPLVSDFEMMYQAAEDLLAGDLSFKNTEYFSLWAYQSAFVAWEAFWLKIWNNPIFLELLNALMSSVIVCLLYRMIKNKVSTFASQAAAILLTFFPFFITFHTVLTNQIPSLFFFVLALWVLTCEDCAQLRFWRWGIAGLLAQCGSLIRSEGIIIVVAVLAWVVFRALENQKDTKKLIIGMAVFLCVYFIAFTAADHAVRVSGLNDNGLSNGNPGWKFVLGLNPQTCGMYSEDDLSKIWPTLDENYHITEETERIQQEMIQERLSSLPQVARLVVQKIRVLWEYDALGVAFGHTQVFPPWYRKQAYEMMCQFDRGLFMMANLLALTGFIDRWWKKQLSADCCLLYFVAFAFFCALLPIEVQPRYAYLAQPFLFTASAFGLDGWKKVKKHA